jgi:hypothetical protein
LLPIDMVSTTTATMPFTTRQVADDSLLIPANQSGAAETVPYRARASIQSCRNVLLRQPRLIQRNQLSRLRCAEPRLSHLLSSLSDQLKHTALGNAVPPAKLSGGHPCHVLSYQALDRLSLQSFAEATFLPRLTRRRGRIRPPSVTYVSSAGFKLNPLRPTSVSLYFVGFQPSRADSAP